MNRADAGHSGRCVVWSDRQAVRGEDLGGDSYSTFAAPFFARLCTRCHDRQLTTLLERSSAPLSVNLDDEEGVRRALARVRTSVGVTHSMPYSAPLPTCDERLRLVRWIDAETPGL